MPFTKTAMPLSKVFVGRASFFLRFRLLGRRWVFVVRPFDPLHPAAAFKDNPFVHHHGGSLEVSKNPSRGMDFDLLRGEEIAPNLPAHDQMSDLNLGLDDGVVSDNQSSVPGDFPFEMPVDPDGTGKRELSVELRVLSQKGFDFIPWLHVLISAPHIEWNLLAHPWEVGK